ncbi:trans-aconitate 2-methyltransferase [Saccharopolyspora halophila]|uniref:Trans-aconitate 2-methyltransferase n=1 Tax=Saccharopolyspora halophila TaxID=405551 RepID=A0ABN3GEZ0_9PSEU
MWDPGEYLAFSDHRARPAHELMARVGAASPRRVVDLGCGAGNLTHLLADRWPDAELEALDSSPDMVRAARERGVPARVGDVRAWRPGPDVDVVLCNAVLQWVPEHVQLLRGWIPDLPAGAWFAFQVPGNFDAPSHNIIRELAGSSRWGERLREVPLRKDAVLDPQDYADIAADAGAAVDAWETTYVQAMRGENPVLEWVAGTALRPIRAALDDAEWELFRAELAPELAAAYPRRSDGVTWFAFRRVFVVAQRP